MKLGDLLARLDRLQHGRLFKIIASALVLLAALGWYGTVLVNRAVPEGDPAAAVQPAPPPAENETPEAKAQRELVERLNQTLQGIARDVLSARSDPVNLGITLGIAVALALVVIWLGLGLTYLGLSLIILGVAWPLSLEAVGMQRLATIIVFAVGLIAAMTALMRVGRILLGGPSPVFAVARNMLIEAVRLKVSLVLIVLLVVVFAGLPLMLDPGNPLRYRVQTFLQYGVGGSFWIVALLTLLFSVSSVTAEQRERQIWQTMTKPVAPAQYVLGKWLGVVTLNAILLAVCLSGVYMFTEYLRRQPAEGEQIREVAGVRQAEGITPDRLLLETHILVARASRSPEQPVTRDDPEFARAVEAYIARVRESEPDYASTAAERDKATEDLFKQIRDQLQTIAPGAARPFRFTGLQEAKERGLPLTLRVRVNAGGNMPGELYRIMMVFQGVRLPDERLALGAAQTILIPFPHLINDDGTAELVISNGVLAEDPDRPGQMGVLANPESMSFPIEDGLQLSWKSGGFTANLFRVGVVLWIKLAFLSIIGIALGTFLSFPIACIVAMTLFLAAESAGYLSSALEAYSALDSMTDEVIYWRVPIRAIGLTIAWVFSVYAGLDPVRKLVDGRLLGWGEVSYGLLVLAGLSAVVLAAAVAVFRKRELATYSGQ